MLQSYEDKGGDYFAHARKDIEPLLARRAERALEVGCGKGGTMRWLRETGRVDRACGVELFESAAVEARAHFDTVLSGDAETMIDTSFQGDLFDLILCLDVLEHMIDPWHFVHRLEGRLAPGGKLVISVPNIRCLRVLVPLLFKGRWDYADEGILDRTHLRFFVRETALALARGSSLQIEGCLETRPPESTLAKINRWSLGALHDLTAVQYVIASSRPADASTRPPTSEHQPSAARSALAS